MASIVKQLEGQRKALSEMQENMDARIAEVGQLNATIEQMKTEHAEAITALNDQLSKAAEAVTAEVEKGAALSAFIDQLKSANDALTTEKTEVHAEVEKLQQALADPAYAAAAAKGEKPIDGAGEAGDGNTASCIKQWNAIRDPEARAAFYAANKDAIKAELKG